MPKKNTLKSRKNKRQFSLKKATRKRGGGILSNVSNLLSRRSKPKQDDLIPPEPKLETYDVFSRRSKPKQEPKRDDVIPSVPEPKTFKDLEKMFHGIIPLDIFNINMEKIQEYKRQEENHLKNLKKQEEMLKMAEMTMEDIKRQDEDRIMRAEMHDTDDAVKAAQKWEPISQPPPLQPRSNKEEPATD